MSEIIDSAADRLDQARSELAQATKRRDELHARQREALADRAEYEAWTEQRDNLNREIDRLTMIVVDFEAPARAEEAMQREKSTRLRHAARAEKMPELAARTQSVFRQIAELMLPLLEEVALSDIECAEINREVKELGLSDLKPLRTVNALARTAPALPEIEVKREPVDVWFKRGTDFVIQDESSIDEILDPRTNAPTGKGQIRHGSRFYCDRRTVDCVSFYAATAAVLPEPMWQIRLQHPDKPGIAFDGTKCLTAREALAELARANWSATPKERELEVRLETHPKFVAPRRVKRSAAHDTE